MSAPLFDEPRAVGSVGDLLSNIWQVCYITHDLDQGMALLRDRYGIESTEVPTEENFCRDFMSNAVQKSFLVDSAR